MSNVPSEIEHAAEIIGHHVAPHAIEYVKENSDDIIETVVETAVEIGKGLLGFLLG